MNNLNIAIVGAGSIGSFTALALTKLGVQHLSLWDKDEVELHNVSNQFFTKESLGIPKVVATLQECQRYTPTSISIDFHNEVFEAQNLGNFDIVIVLTDNIEGRKAVFEAVKKSTKTTMFIDGRMRGELFRTFSFNPKNEVLTKEYYDDYIDGVANEVLPCTARSIIYNVLMASSIIASFVKKFTNGEATPFQFLFNFGNYSLTKSKME